MSLIDALESLRTSVPDSPKTSLKAKAKTEPHPSRHTQDWLDAYDEFVFTLMPGEDSLILGFCHICTLACYRHGSNYNQGILRHAKGEWWPNGAIDEQDLCCMIDPETMEPYPKGTYLSL